jgi:hypothetical protein
MATINTAELAIFTDKLLDRANVTVNCDVEFTEVEVNAMNILGMQYELSCRVLDKDLLDDEPVLVFSPQSFPSVPGAAMAYEHALFEAITTMTDMHLHIVGKDKLVAELTLKNTETGTQAQTRTEVLAVDLSV